MTTKTATFRALHADPSQPLILPNIWDVGGARILESLGAKAIATTSAGVAWSLGYPDGNFLPAPLAARLAQEITSVVKIPLSIDFEAGYSDAPSVAAENLKPLLAAGIAGINIEDGTNGPAVLARKIEAIRNLASSTGVDLFVNARTDVYLQDLVPADQAAAETLSRAALYRSAGADGLFVPGLTDTTEIARITAGAGLPVNLMASPALPKKDELIKLNVRRLSAGAGLSKIICAHFVRLAESFLQTGDCTVLGEEALEFSQMQKLFSGLR